MRNVLTEKELTVFANCKMFEVQVF